MDESDFQSLIASHYPRIRRAALVLSGGNAWDADDLAQETMLQAASGCQRLAEGSGRQPVFGIYVPGGVEPLNAADLSPAEQRAVYRVLGIQPVSINSNTL